MESNRRRLTRRRDTRYVGYNHSNSDELTMTNVCHRHIASTAGSNHGKNSVSNTGEQTQMVVTEGDREALGNRVQLRAVVCTRLTQQAQIPAHVVSCWVPVWRAPTFWWVHLNKSTKARGRNVLMRRVRAHCTNCELCAGNRCLECTLAICWDFTCF